MKKMIVSVRDLASHQYTTLLLEDSEYTASRSFESSYLTCKARKEGMLWTHAEDFELRCIGYFDTDDGSIEPCERFTIVSGEEIAFINEGGSND